VVSVGHDCEPCKSGKTDRVRNVVSSGPRKRILHRVQISTCEGAILRTKESGPGHARTCPMVDILNANQ